MARMCCRASVAVGARGLHPQCCVVWSLEAKRPVLRMSALQCLRLAAARSKVAECRRSWVSCRARVLSSQWSSASPAVRTHGGSGFAMGLLVRVESTSSECRAGRIQSVPVRSARMTAVHGWGGRQVLPCLCPEESMARCAVCRDSGRTSSECA